MAPFTVAAVQAAYVPDGPRSDDRQGRGADRGGRRRGARLVVFPEAFVPGDPIWKDAGPIWEGDDAWYRLLVDQAVVVRARRPIASEPSHAITA